MIVSMEDFKASTHPLFERWKALKGRKVLCPEWHASFREFLAGVGMPPEGHKKLRRFEQDKPYAPGNVEWSKTPTREETLAYYKQWNRANPEVRWAKHLMDNFGITPDDYKRMFAAQNGLCAICNRPENASHKARKNGEKRRLAVDHCHGSTKVRSLLCTNCNTALGALDDNLDLFRKAIAYIEDWSAKHAEDEAA
jgi:hypothetical protein